MTDPPETWRGAVCYDSLSIAKVVRETLDHLGWEYERDSGKHYHSRMMIVFALPRASYVFKFLVSKPAKLEIHVYDEQPTHSGVTHYIEITGITKKNAPGVRGFLQEFAGRLPRSPYRFFWSERFRLGLIRPEHMKAKGAWARWGI